MIYLYECRSCGQQFHSQTRGDAIPPAYTEHIGRQLLDHLSAAPDPQGTTD